MRKFLSGIALAAFAAGMFMVPPVQAADTTVVVTPSNMQGWGFFQETPTGSGTMESGPSTPPLGTGSANLIVDSTGGVILAKTAYAGTRLIDITNLEYGTYRVSGGPALAIALQMDFDNNTTDSDTAFKGRLIYEPYHTNTVTTGAWQTWDPMDSSGSGNWWFSNGTIASTSGCAQANPCTWSEVLTAFPNGGIRNTSNAAIYLKAGGGWTGGFDGNVDALIVGVNGNNTRFNFEPNAPADTTDPAVPTHVSPSNGDTLTTAELDKVDWSDVADSSTPVTYIYQASNSSATNTDGSFEAPVYTSGPLTSSEIATPGTPEGTYYWHVRALDGAGNESPWSAAWSFTIDNSPPDPDSDNDGVLNENDFCSGTSTSDEGKWTKGLGNYRYEYHNDGWYQKDRVRSGRRSSFQIVKTEYPLADTHGCSGMQILDEIKAATGDDMSSHYRLGISRNLFEEVMEDGQDGSIDWSQY
ncbi:MAG: hypothetical protein M3Q64_01375 [bacterium]|nr:hypothetical protein [bacterium]